MYKIKSHYIIELLIFTVLFTLNCSSGGGSTTPSYNVDAGLAKGWSEFSTSNYNDAVNSFSEVLDHSEDNIEALLGRGWSYGYLMNFNSAITDLNVITDQMDDPDAFMALAGIYRDYPHYQMAISYASEGIDYDSNYIFSKQTSINFKDAHLIKAQCYFRRGNNYYSSAHTEVDYLCQLEGMQILPDPQTLSDAEYELLLSQTLESLTSRLGN